jgi:hypothetical protein
VTFVMERRKRVRIEGLYTRLRLGNETAPSVCSVRGCEAWMAHWPSRSCESVYVFKVPCSRLVTPCLQDHMIRVYCVRKWRVYTKS